VVVNKVEVEAGQQDAYFDNIYFNHQIGIDSYYVAFGDSITVGFNDDIVSDGIGYEPILDNLLTSTTGNTTLIANEGESGEDSSEALGRIQNVIDGHPGAQYFLILYGANDSHGSMPIPSGWHEEENRPLNRNESGYAGSFLDNMQQIIDAIAVAGKNSILGKSLIALGPCSSCEPFSEPDTAPRNLLIKQYNKVIDALVDANEILFNPPDFYNHYKTNQNEMADNLHPNGTGYQSMANLWFNALTN
jgi:lysophospholipase L1-like esterase